MIKALIKVFFGVAVLAVVLVVAGGYWLENNADTVADAAFEASGAKDQMAKAEELRCQSARREFQSAWDRAVESGTDEQQADQLSRMEEAVEIVCRKA